LHCPNCKKSILKNAKYCNNCGENIETRLGSVEKYFLNTDKTCKNCGEIRPLKYVKFLKNIGLLIIRQEYSISGNFCKECINKYFINYFFITLFLGWWGVISFIMTPLYLINNLYYYFKTIGLKKEFK